MASSQKIEPGSFNIPVGTFPQTYTPTSPSSTPPTELANEVANTTIKALNAALSTANIPKATSLFLKTCSFWRDHLTLSWALRTAKGRDKIESLLNSAENITDLHLSIDRSTAYRAPKLTGIDGLGVVQGVQFFITLEKKGIGRGRGIARLAHEDGEWRIYTLYMVLQEISGLEERIGARRPFGAVHGEVFDRQNWQERRDADIDIAGAGAGEQPTVLIVGAGQSGLSIAARLKMLGVRALVIDREDRIGDNWRRRYHQLVLHDPVWFDHMPYLPFPGNWPVFTPKDKLAGFLECYVKLLELGVWAGTVVEQARWSEEEGVWTVDVDRRGERRVLRPRHVIQATGHSGEKNLPSFKGVEGFAGRRMCHSSEFDGAVVGGKGRKAVVVGSCNSAQDIAQDYYEKGYDVTLVQRSSTCVISSDSIVNIGLKGLYEENGPPVEDADIWLYGMPSEQFKAQQVKITALQNAHDKELLDGLAKAGFKVDRGPDDAGLLVKYWQRGGGYTIDVGTGRLIADGKIKIKQGQEVTEVLPHGIRFGDGSELEADEIVFATGYQNMRTQTRATFGDEVADRVNSVWGLDEEGEFRTIWRRSGHPGFWFMGGNLALCRYYSQLLALQILAVEEGLTSRL
ncbi:hypothetical protein BJX76DRAFT_365378 [Aspergillus varians]